MKGEINIVREYYHSIKFTVMGVVAVSLTDAVIKYHVYMCWHCANKIIYDDN